MTNLFADYRLGVRAAWWDLSCGACTALVGAGMWARALPRTAGFYAGYTDLLNAPAPRVYYCLIIGQNPPGGASGPAASSTA